MAESNESRVAILDAGEARFAAQGFDATTIKQIAGDAGVNSALIYYYFADKTALYTAVVARLIDTVAGAMSGVLQHSADPAAAVRGFALAHHRMLAAKPEVRRILGRELVDYDAAHAQDPIRRLAAGTFERLRAAIVAGQEAGIFRRDIDARFATLSLVSQTTYFHLARPIVSMIFADGGTVPPSLGDAFAEHAATFTLAALAPRSDA